MKPLEEPKEFITTHSLLGRTYRIYHKDKNRKDKIITCISILLFQLDCIRHCIWKSFIYTWNLLISFINHYDIIETFFIWFLINFSFGFIYIIIFLVSQNPQASQDRYDEFLNCFLEIIRYTNILLFSYAFFKILIMKINSIWKKFKKEKNIDNTNSLMVEIYIFELYYSGAPLKSGIQYDIIVHLEKFETLEDHSEQLLKELYIKQKEKKVLLVGIENKPRFYLVSLNSSNFTQETVLTYVDNYDFENFSIENHLDTYKVEPIIRLSEKEYIYLENGLKHLVKANIYTRDFEKTYYDLVCSSEWFVDGSHVVSIYADYSCDEDVGIWNDAATKESGKIIQEIFDYLKNTTGKEFEFYLYYVHTNTSSYYSSINKHRYFQWLLGSK
jgi:hypothetical protein